MEKRKQRGKRQIPLQNTEKTINYHSKKGKGKERAAEKEEKKA